MIFVLNHLLNGTSQMSQACTEWVPCVGPSVAWGEWGRTLRGEKPL